MDPASIILLLNGLINLGLQISNNYTAPAGTPEEQKAQLDAILVKLKEMAEAVAAWKPIE